MPENQRIRTATHQNRIEVGDTVSYTKRFLKRHGQYSNAMFAGQGKVKALHRLPDGTTLADIEWSEPDLPKRANVRILTKR
jgi:hypothetical protein